MRLERLTTLDGADLSDYARLTDVALRRVQEPAGGLYLAESITVIGRALRAGHRPRSVLTSERWLDDLEAAGDIRANQDAAASGLRSTFFTKPSGTGDSGPCGARVIRATRNSARIAIQKHSQKPSM